MRILCVDVGTGTQDILLFDSSTELENCVQMVMPSPAEIVARRVREATSKGHVLLLSGVTMGGGPGAWAVEKHIEAGLAVHAVPDAARTFDDDLQRVEAMGVQVVEPEVLASTWGELGPERATLLQMEDVTLSAVDAALLGFHEPPHYDALAVAAFDHGNAPPGYSDRRFRFDYIARQMAGRADEPVGDLLAAFAAPSPHVHPDLTRLRAIAATIGQSERAGLPLLLMDTGPAALLGALGDPVVSRAAEGNAIFVNVGNFHVLAFHIVRGRIISLFEHHTGLLDSAKLSGLLVSLADGTLTNQAIFDDSGHGALQLSAPPAGEDPSLCMATGPRRSLLASAQMPWPLYLAVPHGDMMLAGCYGLLRAFAAHFPEHAPHILSRLEGHGRPA